MVKPKWFQRNEPAAESTGVKQQQQQQQQQQRGRIKQTWLKRTHSRRFQAPPNTKASTLVQNTNTDKQVFTATHMKKKTTPRDESEDDQEICMILQQQQQELHHPTAGDLSGFQSLSGYSTDSPCHHLNNNHKSSEKARLLGTPVRSSTFGKSRKGFHWNLLPIGRNRSPVETVIRTVPPKRSNKQFASDDDFSSGSSMQGSEGGKSIVTLVKRTDSLDDELGSLLTYNADVSAVESADDPSEATKEHRHRIYVVDNGNDNKEPTEEEEEHDNDEDEESSHAAQLRGQQVLRGIVPPCIPGDLPQSRRSDLLKLVTMASEDFSMETASTSRGSSYDSRESIEGCTDTFQDIKTILFGQCGVSYQD